MRYVISGWTGRPIAFKPATFYLEIVGPICNGADGSRTTSRNRDSELLRSIIPRIAYLWDIALPTTDHSPVADCI
jgi:hypothetical protein